MFPLTDGAEKSSSPFPPTTTFGASSSPAFGTSSTPAFGSSSSSFDGAQDYQLGANSSPSQGFVPPASLFNTAPVQGTSSPFGGSSIFGNTQTFSEHPDLGFGQKTSPFGQTTSFNQTSLLRSPPSGLVGGIFSRSSSFTSNNLAGFGQTAQTCSICLTNMGQGSGQALFTAACSHSFHFHCIASNLKHGNQLCPVCGAKWKDIPFTGPSLGPIPFRAPPGPINWPQNYALNRRHTSPFHQAPEAGVFDDDESLNHQAVLSERSPCGESSEDKDGVGAMEIKMYPEVAAAPRSSSYSTFTVLVNLKAAAAAAMQNSQTPRAHVDLVTVLDISGSMHGAKLAQLKRAMGFVIQNLGSNDRLSIVAFSSTARRLIPLCRMTDSGRQLALQAVNSLVADGSTNIAQALKKGAKIIEDRKEKNPVASIILLSDGQDNCTFGGRLGANRPPPNYRLLLPDSISGNSGFQIPVHAFGFGADHDAIAMHSIAVLSGGTFSFIEAEAVLQDAFAQCIGGLLSVVVQELQVEIECTDPNLGIVALKAGSYPSRVVDERRKGFIKVGDLYADEERDFLVSVDVPATSGNETWLIKVKCVYRDPLTNGTATVESEEMKIERPEHAAGQVVMSLEVDRQRNRLLAAEAMAQARVTAEQGDLSGAVWILENCRNHLSETVSAKSGDSLCVALDAELKEMQERMGTRPVYEASGRAFALGGWSSHASQRATARGDRVAPGSCYQTPPMAKMVARSQAAVDNQAQR